jgi:hypothetical protein
LIEAFLDVPHGSIDIRLVGAAKSSDRAAFR